MLESGEYFFVGTLGRARGLKGEVYLSLENPFEDYEAYFEGRPTLVVGDEKSFLGRLEQFRRDRKNPKQSTLQISTLSDREAAEKVSGKKVFISKSKVSEVRKQETQTPHPSQLIGFSIKGQAIEGEPVILEYYLTPAHPVLVTDQFEAPLVSELVQEIRWSEKLIEYRGPVLNLNDL